MRKVIEHSYFHMTVECTYNKNVENNPTSIMAVNPDFDINTRVGVSNLLLIHFQ